MRFKKLVSIALGAAMFATAGSLTGIDALAEELPENIAENVEIQEDDEISVDEAVEVSKGMQYGYRSYTDAGVEKKGDYWYYNGTLITNSFFFDGSYTYFLQADGTPMKGRLTYHPDGEHIIYFDENGHEVFAKFVFCEDVQYTCYFGSDGYIYKDQITFNEYGSPYYLNANGKMEDSGWFQFANGRDWGYAYESGCLVSNGFERDPYYRLNAQSPQDFFAHRGEVYYFHWNGMVARGLIQDNNYYYLMDETDGHYTGKFPTGATPVFAAGEHETDFVVGVNIPAGEVVVTPDNSMGYMLCEYSGCGANGSVLKYGYKGSQIITLCDGDVLRLIHSSVSYDVNNTPITIGEEDSYSNPGCKVYSYDAKIGVHLPAGRYRIQFPDNGYATLFIYTSSVYSINWNAYNAEKGQFIGSHLNNVRYEQILSNGNNSRENSGKTFEVTVSDGEILSVDNVVSVEYLGQ